MTVDKKYKVIAILRIKDEILIVKEVLNKLSEFIDEIIILDNGSTDGTLEVYKEFNKVIEVLQTEGFNEGRDKIMLLEAAQKRNPDWILWIDADEVFEKHFNRKVVDSYMRSDYNRIKFRMYNFWLSKKSFRLDGNFFLYTLHPQRSMWKNTGNEYFRDKFIHNGDIMGVKGKSCISPYRIKHYGYIFKDKVVEKNKNYNKIDKQGSRSYDHTNPENKVKTFKFIEFDNRLLNSLYIYFYKYLSDLTWYSLRLILKIKKLTLKR